MKRYLALMLIVMLMVGVLAACQPKPEAPMPDTNQPNQNESMEEQMEEMPEYYIYTANEDEASVSIINMATMKVENTIPVGLNPHNVQVTPDGKFVFVVEGKSNTISAIDTTTGKSGNTIKVGEGPSHIVFSPDSKTAYVTVAEMAEVEGMNMADDLVNGNVYVIDIEKGSITAKIPVGKMPHGLRMSPDNKYVAVANTESDNVSKVPPVR